MTDHSAYLSLALTQATLRRGFCAPNPSVGAVVVKHNQVLATGYHWAVGHAHAEVDALKKLGDEARGASLYVTLEPCCHQGKTPPCTQLIIERGISEVYYAYSDPNPRVSGKGETALKDAGIFCQRLALDDIDCFYQSYAYWCQTQRPWVTAKLALSIDGKIAGPQGEPVAITGPELQKYTHRWRQRCDAILTTAKTIVQDDPQMNVRLAGQIIKKPVYIIDRQLKTPVTARILTAAHPLTVFHSTHVTENRKAALQTLGVRCLPVSLLNDQLDLDEVMRIIGQEGVHDLWVEAGGLLFQSLIRQKQVQRSLIYVGLKNLGPNYQSAFNEAENLFAGACSVEWQQVGKDLVCNIKFPSPTSGRRWP